MNPVRWSRLYSLALRLFPAGERAEYSEEMSAVFELRAQDAASQGWHRLVLLFFKELRDLPAALLAAYARERRRLAVNGPGNSDSLERAGWRQTLASLAPFAFFALLLCIPNLLRLYVDDTPFVLLLLLAILLAPVVWGVYRTILTGRVQSWFLPEAGLVMAIIGFLLTSALRYPMFLRRLPFWLRILYTQGVDWWVITALVVVLVLNFRNTRYSAQLKDWTLPSFLIYGAIMFGVYITYSDYPVKDIFYLNYFFYLLLSALALGVGALMYMRSRKYARKFMWLLLGALAAVAVAAAGKTYMILAGGFTPHAVDWVNELNHTLAAGGWMLLALASPLLLRQLMRPKVKTA